MSYIKPSPYILQELPNIQESLNYPIKNVQRVKYTCFDVSKTLIAFGATSGGIYVFNRVPCEFVQLIPNKDGAITRLAISTNEKHIGFANGRGIVTVTECTQSLSGGHFTVTSKDHQGNEVTAMAWSDNMLFTGDDVGKISVLLLQSFIVKTFQSASQTIMSLDSRICQIDVRASMLLVSTLSRCYICDTSQEQYRQIGQKLRDGEFGACFVNKEKNLQSTPNNDIKDFTEVKKYNMVNEESKFAVGKELESTIIFCARPSSRLWEVAIDGTVKRTHQFKQVLAKNPLKVISVESYESENVFVEKITRDDDGQSVCFSKIYSMNSAIFCYRKDALYFLNFENVDDTVWYDSYKDIVDCKVYHDTLYVWLSNGSLINLRFMKIDKFLLKCYVDEKYVLCAEMCALYSDYLLENDLPIKLHILVGLRDKIENKDLLNNIACILEKFDSFKSKDATQMKSGIYVVDNTYNAQSSLYDNSDEEIIQSNEDYRFSTISPEAMQTLKDLSITVSDKLTTSKKILKEKWEDFEGKIKHLGTEKQQVQEIIIPKRITNEEQPCYEETSTVLGNDIIFKESSQKAIEVDNNTVQVDKTCRSLYQYFRLSLVGKVTDRSNYTSIIDSYSCDINQILNLMLSLEEYCITIGDLDESKYVPNNIFLTYLSLTHRKEEFIDSIIKDEALYKYFVDSCILVNMKTQKILNIGCECGFPLPYARTNQTPVFSELIDEFIERQWSCQTRDQCYDMCKRMPYLWRKILYLRRNEDLLNILRILLQMLDENLLHSFLPQFTLDIWDRAVQLYATLYANICLNCSKKFSHISVKEMLSWDDLGALMIKSVGGKNAIKVMEKHAALIDKGEITVMFYHTSLLVTMFEKFDSTVTSQLTDAIYSSYHFEDAKDEICKLLRSSLNGVVKNTALPIAVAAKSAFWGLTLLKETTTQSNESLEVSDIENPTLQHILDNLFVINNGFVDCLLCGLPLQNEVLIKDGGLWVFKCGHTFHGACLELNRIKLCPSCSPTSK